MTSSHKHSEKIRLKSPQTEPERNGNRKRRTRSESSNSSSSSSSDRKEEEEEEEKSPTRDHKETKQTLMAKKESILKNVQMLMDQKRCLDAQREEISQSDQGEGSLQTILNENSSLNDEITKQIHNMCSLVTEIDRSIQENDAIVSSKASKSKKVSKKKKSRKKHKKRQRDAESSEEDESRAAKLEKILRSEKFNDPEPIPLETGTPGGVVAPRYWDIVKPIAKPVKSNTNSKRNEEDEPDSHSHSKWSNSKRNEKEDESHAHSKWSRDRYDDHNEKKNELLKSREKGHELVNKATISDSKRDWKENVSGKSKGDELDEKEEDSKGKKLTEKELLNRLTNMHYKRGKAGDKQDKPKEEEGYIDQGMHWCSHCNVFFETMPFYTRHLLLPSHLNKLKVSKRH